MDLKNKKEKSAAKSKFQKRSISAEALLDRAGIPERKQYRDRRRAIQDFEAFHSMNIRLHEQEKAKQNTELKEEHAKNVGTKKKSEPKTKKESMTGFEFKIEKSELEVDKQIADTKNEPAKVVKKKRKSKRNKDESKSKIVTPAVKIQESEPRLETEKARGIRNPGPLCPEKVQKKKSKRKQKKKSKSIESEKSEGDNPKEETGMRFPFSRKLEYKAEKYEEKTDKAKFLNEIALKMITFRMKNQLTISGAGDQISSGTF